MDLRRLGQTLHCEGGAVRLTKVLSRRLTINFVIVALGKGNCEVEVPGFFDLQMRIRNITRGHPLEPELSWLGNSHCCPSS